MTRELTDPEISDVLLGTGIPQRIAAGKNITPEDWFVFAREIGRRAVAVALIDRAAGSFAPGAVAQGTQEVLSAKARACIAEFLEEWETQSGPCKHTPQEGGIYCPACSARELLGDRAAGEQTA